MHITQDLQQKFDVKQASLVKPDTYVWSSECGEKALPHGICKVYGAMGMMRCFFAILFCNAPGYNNGKRASASGCIVQVYFTGKE